MPISSDYISVYFIVHFVACVTQINKNDSERIKLQESKKLTRVPQIGVKLDVSRVDCALENRERQIESTWCLSHGGLDSA